MRSPASALPSAHPIPPHGSSTVQFVRTVPEHVYGGLRQGSFGVLETYVRAIRSAERLIYIESQYLWSPEIVALLAEKLRDPPHDRFRMLLVLPGRPKGGSDDTRGALAELIAADGGAGRVLACSLYAPAGSVADLIYVHAKVGVIDDRLLIVGSANLNDHSMFNDTEAALVTDDAELAARDPSQALGGAPGVLDRRGVGRRHRADRSGLAADGARTSTSAAGPAGR